MIATFSELSLLIQAIVILTLTTGTLLVLLVTAYLVSRAVSIAHFRTKLEYFRSVTKGKGGVSPHEQ